MSKSAVSGSGPHAVEEFNCSRPLGQRYERAQSPKCAGCTGVGLQARAPTPLVGRLRSSQPWRGIWVRFIKRAGGHGLFEAGVGIWVRFAKRATGREQFGVRVRIGFVSYSKARDKKQRTCRNLASFLQMPCRSAGTAACGILNPPPPIPPITIKIVCKMFPRRRYPISRTGAGLALGQVSPRVCAV
jgi:hypothetical protein